MLWEQAHVGAAIAWFAALTTQLPGSTVTVVTTAREERERQHLIDALTRCPRRQITARRFPHLTPTELRQLTEADTAGPDGYLAGAEVRSVLSARPLTYEVVADLLRRPELAGAPVRHVHYRGEGRKAAQVNYAVAQMPTAREHDYIAVYDVDSRPDLALLRRTLGYIAARHRADGQPPAVVQQSARFETSGTADQAWQRHLCSGAARLQTLWTLRREIPSFRRYAAAIQRPTGVTVLDAARRGLAQTVGHGLLVRIDVHQRVGGLPEYTILDDLPFGYQLTTARLPVHAAPVMLVAPAPERVGDLIATHRRWFRSYLDYPACARAARHAGRGTPVEQAIALGVAGYRAATWLLATPATAACAVAVVRSATTPPTRTFAAAALWLGGVAPVRVLAAQQAHRPGLAAQARDAAEVFAAYLVQSIGPVAAIVDAATSAGLPLSPKTHRRGPDRKEQK
ncbi:hypothetical protein [Phytohabitans kaempferiae]|uniref:Glycosyltransferase 2-like domain-containing protein n=1 Tax=Phytohabitans kaempferiae TaxID=1620943 RepID=A0ABV6MCF1_9ACTN